MRFKTMLNNLYDIYFISANLLESDDANDESCQNVKYVTISMLHCVTFPQENTTQVA